jgi:hypothetical protein
VDTMAANRCVELIRSFPMVYQRQENPYESPAAPARSGGGGTPPRRSKHAHHWWIPAAASGLSLIPSTWFCSVVLGLDTQGGDFIAVAFGTALLAAFAAEGLARLITR